MEIASECSGDTTAGIGGGAALGNSSTFTLTDNEICNRVGEARHAVVGFACLAPALTAYIQVPLSKNKPDSRSLKIFEMNVIAHLKSNLLFLISSLPR